jgi:hypothetical protein
MDKYLSHFISLAVGVLMTIAGQFWYHEKVNEISYIDTFLDQKFELLVPPEIPNHDLKIFIDDQKVDELSKVSMALINFSGKDFENIEFVLEIKSTNDKSISLVGANVNGREGVKELVEELPIDNENQENKTIKKKYSVKTANRTADLDPFFEGEFIFNGKDDYQIKVIPLTKGFDVRKFDYSHSDAYSEKIKNEWFKLIFVAMIFVLILFAVVFPFIAYISRPIDRKNELIFTENFYKAIDQHKAFSKIDEEKKKQLTQELVFMQREQFYKSKSFIYRWVFGLKKPIKDQFKF